MPPWRTSKLLKKPSALKRGHPTLQNMKFLKKILLFWVIFALLDPDPLTRLNPDLIRIRIRIRIRNPALKDSESWPQQNRQSDGKKQRVSFWPFLSIDKVVETHKWSLAYLYYNISIRKFNWLGSYSLLLYPRTARDICVRDIVHSLFFARLFFSYGKLRFTAVIPGEIPITSENKLIIFVHCICIRRSMGTGCIMVRSISFEAIITNGLSREN